MGVIHYHDKTLLLKKRAEEAEVREHHLKEQLRQSQNPESKD
jgi:hypothetical protein